MTTYQTYEQTAQAYLAEFSALLAAPPATGAVSRGAGELPADLLIDKAERIADLSADMVKMSEAYLRTSDPLVREGVSGQLIVQAAAELQLAIELLEITEEEQGRPAVTRAARGSALRNTIDALEQSMAMPIAKGLLSGAPRTRGAPPSAPDAATRGLKDIASSTMAAIVQRVRELGGDIVYDIVTNTPWSVVADAASLLGKDIAEKLQAVKESVGAFIVRAVAAAQKTLLNVYDKILALLGKDAEDAARKKIREWLEAIQKEGRVDLFEKLLNHLYRTEDFKRDIERRLAATEASVDVLNRTSDSVSALADKFIVLHKRIGTLADVIAFAKLVKAPYVASIAAGLQVALLAALVYGGYDYIGYETPDFLSFTKGIGEVIEEALG